MKSSAVIAIVCTMLADFVSADAYYSPARGRWLSRDPLSDKLQNVLLPIDVSPRLHVDALIHSYVCVMNNVIGSVDWFGLMQTPLSSAELTQCTKDIESAAELVRNALDKPGCKCAFSATPRCGDPVARLNDLEIVIDNYGDVDGGDHGYTYPTDGEWRIWVTPFACRLGRWDLGATIVHELMHECDDYAGEEDSAFGAESACGFETY